MKALIFLLLFLGAGGVLAYLYVRHPVVRDDLHQLPTAVRSGIAHGADGMVDTAEAARRTVKDTVQ